MESKGKKNLTVALPADLIREAKVIAAKRGTSLNAMVHESLRKIVNSEDEYTAAAMRFINSPVKYKLKSKKWLRSELYER
ncbi:MAG: hypothetical protein ACRD4P_05765 [Bryobacteraceae bacterium]